MRRRQALRVQHDRQRVAAGYSMREDIDRNEASINKMLEGSAAIKGCPTERHVDIHARRLQLPMKEAEGPRNYACFPLAQGHALSASQFSCGFDVVRQSTESRITPLALIPRIR